MRSTATKSVTVRFCYMALAIQLLLPFAGAAGGAERPPAVAIVGEPQPVFEWSRDACEPNDFVDAPARAFRTSDGGIRMFATHFAARAMSGPDGDHLTHDCAVAFRGAQSGDPAAFSDFSWLISPYALGGGKVFALVHNEFQGHRYPDMCAAGDYHRCWENTVTWAMSDDDGRSFHSPPVERRLIAGLPWRYDRDRDRPGGYFNPTNIIAHDGAWYVLAWARAYRDQPQGACLLRTTRLDDPATWRAWDGKDFTVTFVDPNRETVDEPRRHVCKPVGVGVFGSAPSSLVRDEASGRFLALQAGNLPDPNGGKGTVPGVWLSASRDLIDWSPPERIWDVPVWRPRECNPAQPAIAWSVSYPSLIDFDSPSPNFETVSGAAWLYFTRYRLQACDIGKDRSLWRVRVQVGDGSG